MSAVDNVLSNLEAYSLAGYSNWAYLSSINTLFDCGEGVALTMRNFMFGIDRIMLTHGHYDHIGGLGGLIHGRASARGDKEKPLTVYHPPRWDLLGGSIRLFDSYKRLYPLTWVEIGAGFRLEVGRGITLRAFSTKHVRYGITLGYALVEQRKRLRKELAGLDRQQIAEVKRVNGEAAVSEDFEHTLFVFSGDTMPLSPAGFAGADVLMHEATFVDGAERTKEGHSSVQEALEVAKAAQVKALVLYHFSGRSDKGTVVQSTAALRTKVGYEGSVFVQYAGNRIQV